ncbi:MAG: SDR family oxidoreductase [Bacteroidota bacterium]
MTFAQQRVWLTGASSGIGRALALALSHRGARLVLSARRTEALEHVRAACAHPEHHQLLPFDLADLEALPNLAARAQQDGGAINVLIHCGGISQRALAQDTGFEVDRRLMNVNYFAPVILTKAVLPSMLARRQGHVIVVSSLVGKFGVPLRSGYAASKHALHGFFDSLRAECHDNGLRVTIACPGFIRTDISLHALTADGQPQGTMDQAQAGGMAPETCAEQILRAAEADRPEVYIGGREVLGVYLKRLVPSLFYRFIRSAQVT